MKNRIADLRRECGLTQKELGDKLGVGQTTVSAWEMEKNEPDYNSIRAMAALFEVTADYLLGFDDGCIYKGLSCGQGSGMWFCVMNVHGRALYEGASWPMARAALDYAVRLDDGCPRLVISPDGKE